MAVTITATTRILHRSRHSSLVPPVNIHQLELQLFLRAPSSLRHEHLYHITIKKCFSPARVDV